MWKTIYRVLDKDAKSTTLASIEIDGKTLTKERDVLEALNCHFVSVGPKLARSIETRPSDNCLQYVTPVNEEMLFKPVNKKICDECYQSAKERKSVWS